MLFIGVAIAKSGGGFWSGKISVEESLGLIAAGIMLRWNPNL
jgi:hypothetical protein